MDKIIGINVYSALHNPRGMGVYTINLLKGLAKLDKDTKYILYADIDDTHNVLPKQDNFEFKILASKGLFHYEQFVLPKQCQKDQINILHSTAITGPLFLDKNIKLIISLPDVIFLKKEVPLSKNKRQILGRLYYALTTIFNAPKADIILTTTKFSEDDIVSTLKIDRKKIITVWDGYEHFNTDKITSFDELKSKYGIPDSYYFHLGGDAPTKNTGTLLDVFKENKNMNIIVAGIKNPAQNKFANKYANYENITFVPYITQADLVGIYKNSLAYICSSTYEGFGIPLLEAMKCGCPIISSNATCLPEVAGDAAIYFNPQNKMELKEKIELISQNDDLRQELITKGQERLKQFSWRKTAEITLKAYSEI